MPQIKGNISYFQKNNTKNLVKILFKLVLIPFSSFITQKGSQSFDIQLK